jgi:TfuA protein
MEAEIRPPVRSGDLDRLGDGRTVAIIDGVLEPDAVLSLCEIRRALQRGMKVQGAASLGALRAYEAHRDGMEGSGWVFQEYLSGRINGTEEISVAYDPLSHCPLTIPLVNVRFCLHQLVSQGVVALCEVEKAMSDLKCLPIEERNRRALLLQLVQIFGRERLKAAFKDAAGMNSDIKRRDACEMLQRMAARPVRQGHVHDSDGSMVTGRVLEASAGHRNDPAPILPANNERPHPRSQRQNSTAVVNE